MLSAVMAASIVAGSVSAINALAASPRIYVDIVYEDANTPRADIYFENMPALASGGFHINVGSGWNLIMDERLVCCRLLYVKRHELTIAVSIIHAGESYKYCVSVMCPHQSIHVCRSSTTLLYKQFGL